MESRLVLKADCSQILYRQHTLPLPSSWIDVDRPITTLHHSFHPHPGPRLHPCCHPVVGAQCLRVGLLGLSPPGSLHCPGLWESRKWHYEQEASPQEERSTGEQAACPILLSPHRYDENMPCHPGDHPVAVGSCVFLYGMVFRWDEEPQGEWGQGSSEVMGECMPYSHSLRPHAVPGSFSCVLHRVCTGGLQTQHPH